MTRPLAVLRPEPGNAATLQRIKALDLRAIYLPLFEVVPLDWTMPDPAAFDALLLTSANGIRFGGAGIEAFRHLPVLAVGAKTAEIARAAGFDVMAVGDTDASALAALARAHGLERAVHLGGRDRSIEAGGPIACSIAVYASEAVPIAREKLMPLAGSIALLHSARAARRLGELIDAYDLTRSAIGIAAISAAAACAAGTGWAGIATAATPTDSDLIAAARAAD